MVARRIKRDNYFPIMQRGTTDSDPLHLQNISSAAIQYWRNVVLKPTLSRHGDEAMTLLNSDILAGKSDKKNQI